MSYFNHAFRKLFVGTHATQSAVGGTSAAVDFGFLNQAGIQSVALANPAPPYSLGVGVFGLFFQDPTLGLISQNAASSAITTGKPMLLVSTALYANDSISPFLGGFQETTKSKLVNPKYISQFNRIDPCTPNNNVIHIGNTPFTSTPTGTPPTLPAPQIPGTVCPFQFVCDETYYLRIDVKGSPALRFLSRNAYWNMDYYTGCCPANCIQPSPVDSTLVMIGWANQIINNEIVGPFILPVVYDQLGGAWYSPGTSGEYILGSEQPSPGVSTVAITTAGTGYTNGTFYNVAFQNIDKGYGTGFGALATVVVAGGVVTTVTVTQPGSNYTVGNILTFPQLEGGTGATFTVTATIIPTWNNYVSPGYVTGRSAGMSLTGAFVDTRFGDCTFYPSDWFEKQPVNIYASMVDETGDPCLFSGICVVTQCNPRQAMGLGEQILRDVILSESYMQNYFYTGKDLRIREITQGYDVTSAIHRGNLYTRYQILHNVPRFNNPTGVFDNDQYLLDVATNGISASFEATMAAWLTACGCNASLNTISCQLTNCPGVCPTLAMVTLTPTTGTHAVAYTSVAPTASGGTAPYVYEVSSGALPTGLAINNTTGVVSGTPTYAGTYVFSVTATDAAGCNISQTVTLVIS